MARLRCVVLVLNLDLTLQYCAYALYPVREVSLAESFRASIHNTEMTTCAAELEPTFDDCIQMLRCSRFRASRLLMRRKDLHNLVDPASSHMLVSKIKPCMSQYKLLYGETANGSLKQL